MNVRTTYKYRNKIYFILCNVINTMNKQCGDKTHKHTHIYVECCNGTEPSILLYVSWFSFNVKDVLKLKATEQILKHFISLTYTHIQTFLSE